MTVLAVGVSSFVAKSVRARRDAADWAFVGHEDAAAGNFPDFPGGGPSCVVSFALDPRARAGEVTPETNLDARLAQRFRDSGAHYVMLSSRQVYGPAPEDGILRETMPPAPVTPYGKAKLTIERSLVDLLGPDRVTILRIANVFGYEIGRRSFLGMALTRLREEGRIVYDMSPLTRRDFIPVARLAEALVGICAAPEGGIFNLGSGIGVETGLIAEGLAEGFGGGELLATDLTRRDEFRLHMGKMHDQWGIAPIYKDDIYADCVALGRRLKGEKAV